MPEATVVMPVYNGARFVEATIAAVLAQTFGDFELLAIDDGSTDDTPALLAAVADPRLRVITQANRGLAASRNRGVREAVAPLVAFVDADDLWRPGKLAAQVAALRAAPSAGLAYGWTDYVDATGAPLGPGSRETIEGDVLARLLQGNFVASGSNPLVRRATLLDAGGFDERLRAAEDWDMWLRLAARAPFAAVPEVVVDYRIHGGSMSGKLVDQAKATWQVLSAGLRLLPPGPGNAALARRARANVLAYMASRSLASPRSPDRLALAAAFAALYLAFEPGVLLAVPRLAPMALLAARQEGLMPALRSTYRGYREARIGQGR